MRLPEGSFLELNFYFAHLSDQEALARLIAALVDLGATFTGQGWAHSGSGIREQPFRSITDELQEPVSVSSIAELHGRLADPDARLVKVALAGASGLEHEDEVAELITYVGVFSETAALVHHHPVAIWTEGWPLCGPVFDEEDRITARRQGFCVYQRFRALLAALQPSYAALTCDLPLKCPTDLQLDPGSYAFRDFYVSADYVGRHNLDRTRALYAGAYIEPIEAGLYISCTATANPDGIALPVDYAAMGQVARFLADPE